MQPSFRQKEQLFHELSQLTRSGVSLSEALGIMARSGFTAIGRVAGKLREQLKADGTASRAFSSAGFPARDAAFVEAGERSGHLEEVFADLDAYYAQLDSAKKTIITKSLYPIFVYHFGVFVLGLPLVVQSGAAAYFSFVAPLLLGFYGVVFGIYFCGAGVFRLVGRSSLAAQLLLAIPLLGNFLGTWTTWNYSMVLSLYIRAGGGLLRAFELAGESSGNAALAEATQRAISQVKQGQGLAESFRQQGHIPGNLLRAVEIGEKTGRLDSEASRCAEQFKASFLRKLNLIAEWLPRLLYVGVLLIMAWSILQQVFAIGDTYNSLLRE